MGKEIGYVSNLNKIEKGSESKIYEYDVYADWNIKGKINYKSYTIGMWDFDPEYSTEYQRLFLRLEMTDSDDDISTIQEEASKKGYYFEGGIPGEILALSSLALRKRVFLGRLQRINDNPISLPNHKYDNGTHLKQEVKNVSSIREILSKVEGLEYKDASLFLMASKFYSEALRVIDDSPEFSFLNLVTSIEILSQNLEIDDVALGDIDPALSELVEKIENVELKEEIEHRIMKRERMISKKFVRFICDHVDETFFEMHKCPSYCKVTKEDLERHVRNIYNTRSEMLHSGEPLPPTVFSKPYSECELPIAQGAIAGKRVWKRINLIPHLHFIERLVRHVLLVYLDKHILETS